MRELILNNLKWKVSALILAIIVWFVIKAAIDRGGITLSAFGTEGVIIDTFPVMTLTAPTESRTFEITPAEVTVRFTTRSSYQARMARREIKAFVNLADVVGVTGLTVVEHVKVYAPEGVHIVKVEPGAVWIEQVSAAEQPVLEPSLTNSFSTDP